MKKRPPPEIPRRALLWWGGAALVLATVAGALQFLPVTKPESYGPMVSVFKSPDCDCCSKWVQHLRDSGFQVDVHSTNSLSDLKKSVGIPDELESCHTAFVGGYVIEGHVPAEDIQRLLKERPKARGIAVPGMPVGSPGMEQGTLHERYDVLLFGSEQTQIYASHGAP